jgi:hypothetical protein
MKVLWNFNTFSVNNSMYCVPNLSSVNIKNILLNKMSSVTQTCFHYLSSHALKEDSLAADFAPLTKNFHVSKSKREVRKFHF